LYSILVLLNKGNEQKELWWRLVQIYQRRYEMHLQIHQKRPPHFQVYFHHQSLILIFSVIITVQTIPFLPRLVQRFPNLTYLDVTRLSPRYNHIHKLLAQNSTSPLDTKSIAFEEAITTCKSRYTADDNNLRHSLRQPRQYIFIIESAKVKFYF
jgi:hypothetical protein